MQLYSDVAESMDSCGKLPLPYADFRRRRRQKGPVDLPTVPQGIMINGCVSLLTFKSDEIVNAQPALRTN